MALGFFMVMLFDDALVAVIYTLSVLVPVPILVLVLVLVLALVLALAIVQELVLELQLASVLLLVVFCLQKKTETLAPIGSTKTERTNPVMYNPLIYSAKAFHGE